MTQKTTFAVFYEGHAYSADTPVMRDIVDDVSKTAAAKAFIDANEAADAAERKASELRESADTALRNVINELETAITNNAEALGDDFEAAQEAVGEVVGGYAMENGMEHEYSFGGDIEMWEASTC